VTLRADGAIWSQSVIPLYSNAAVLPTRRACAWTAYMPSAVGVHWAWLLAAYSRKTVHDVLL
jgi:hypothetical protein